MNARISIAAAALALAGAVPAAAGGYYSVRPIGERQKASVVTRDTVWTCGGGVCSARKAPERDAVLCGLIVRQVGTIAEFRAGGTAFDADALAECNARARQP